MSELAILSTYSVFLASYIVFALGKFPGMKIDRPGAAIIGAVLLFMTGAIRVENCLRLIHFGTIVLLFSMMLVVAYLHLAGFFDWVTELAVTRLKPHHLLPTVIFLSGLLSAFFVNDIICLVMVPFVLKVTGRMGIKPIPYLLAVATASNIGSTATITGNPQNILIGSFSGIGYRDFLWHLGPVAVAGLSLDWFVLWWLYFREQVHDVRTEPVANAVQIEHAALLKAGIVAALVLAGFLAGFSPALVASVGAAVLLITRTRDPHLGPSRLFRRTLPNRWRRRKRGSNEAPARFWRAFQTATPGRLYPGDGHTLELSEQCARGNAFEVSGESIR
jgi:Na+/H+ antiporter NhaD/arsenite permease-like protein